MTKTFQFNQQEMQIIGLFVTGLKQVEVAYQLQMPMDDLLRHIDHIIEVVGATQTPPVAPHELH